MLKYSARDLHFCLRLEDVLEAVLFCSVQCDRWAQWKTAGMSGRNGACTAPVLLCEAYTWEYRSVKHPEGSHGCKGHIHVRRVQTAALSYPGCC